MKKNITVITTVLVLSIGFISQLFAQNDPIDGVLGNFPVKEKIMDLIFEKQMQPLIKRDTMPDWKTAEVSMAEYGKLGLEKFHQVKMVYYFSIDKDYNEFGRAYRYYFEHYKLHPTQNPDFGNNLSWAVYEHVDDPVTIQVALTVMDRQVQSWPEKADGLDTYAHLLYKSGQKAKALIWQKKAIKLDPANEAIVSSYEKMKSGTLIYAVEEPKN
jgi:tetratricopeptide (TPR) repeat protein